ATELMRLDVDVMVTLFTQASVVAKQATQKIPIIMVGVADPIGAGLVKSLSHPGTSVTGTSSIAIDIVGKQFEILKQVVPSATRAAVLWNPANPVFQASQKKDAEQAGRTLGLRLDFLGAGTADEIDAAFAVLAQRRVAALAVLVDPVFTPHHRRIAQHAA